MTRILPWALLAALSVAGCAEDENTSDDADGNPDADGAVEADADADVPADVPEDLPEDEPEEVAPDGEDVADAPADGDGGAAVGCSIAGEATYGSPTTEAVTFTATIDSLVHHGTLFIPEAGGTFATVILLHKMCDTRAEWTIEAADLANALAQRGFLVLAYDLRGFGESNAGGSLDLCSGTPPESEFAKMTDDLVDAIDWLGTRSEADLDCLGVAGSSIGANVAFIAGDGEPRIDTVVMLSPGLDYFGLQPLPHAAAFEPRESLMVATTGDTYSADTVTTLATAAAHATPHVYDGDAHGTEIFVEQSGSMDEVLDWFSDRL